MFSARMIGESIRLPVSFTALVEVMKMLAKYWFEIVALPKMDKVWK